MRCRALHVRTRLTDESRTLGWFVKLVLSAGLERCTYSRCLGLRYEAEASKLAGEIAEHEADIATYKGDEKAATKVHNFVQWSEAPSRLGSASIQTWTDE